MARARMRGHPHNTMCRFSTRPRPRRPRPPAAATRLPPMPPLHTSHKARHKGTRSARNRARHPLSSARGRRCAATARRGARALYHHHHGWRCHPATPCCAPAALPRTLQSKYTVPPPPLMHCTHHPRRALPRCTTTHRIPSAPRARMPWRMRPRGHAKQKRARAMQPPRRRAAVIQQRAPLAPLCPRPSLKPVPSHLRSPPLSNRSTPWEAVQQAPGAVRLWVLQSPTRGARGVGAHLANGLRAVAHLRGGRSYDWQQDVPWGCLPGPAGDSTPCPHMHREGASAPYASVAARPRRRRVHGAPHAGLAATWRHPPDRGRGRPLSPAARPPSRDTSVASVLGHRWQRHRR